MMKLSTIAILGAAIAASAPFASADTITLGSFATGTTATSLGDSASETAMSYTGYVATSVAPATTTTAPTSTFVAPTYTLAPAGVWANAVPGSTWIGEAANAGPGGTNPAYGYYTFTTTFSAIGGLYSGSIDVLADDTTEVYLDGVLIVPFGALGGNLHCADGQPSCLSQDVVPITSTTLAAGVNTLTFVVAQGGNESPGLDPSGLDFDATLSQSAVPEPNSLVLLGTGLIGSAGMLFRKRQIA